MCRFWVLSNTVALRKESVDRNNRPNGQKHINSRVALRKESVDRNNTMQVVVVVVNASLSARRAWIEISIDDLEQSKTRSRSPQGERG